jgi:putative spermidine/putrescine transport system ATP-binding protein
MGDRDPTTLSGGQQQRVGLARALAVEPRVLLVDEPMTGLDATLKRRLRDEVGDLLEDLGVTALYVTHDRAEAMSMCDRIAVMNRGRLEQVGSPREVYERPVNEFVADFVGTANLLPGSVSGGELDLGFATVPVATDGADGDVTVVARPETFQAVEDGDVRASVAPAGETTVTLKLDAAAVADGETVTLGLDPAALHVTDGDARIAAAERSTAPSARSVTRVPAASGVTRAISAPARRVP